MWMVHFLLKSKKLRESGKQVVFPPIPTPPVSGWTVMTAENYQALADSIPRVSQGKSFFVCFCFR